MRGSTIRRATLLGLDSQGEILLRLERDAVGLNGAVLSIKETAVSEEVSGWKCMFRKMARFNPLSVLTPCPRNWERISLVRDRHQYLREISF